MRTITVIAVAAALTGCRTDFSTPDDALRAQVLDLERENERLRDRNAELEGALAAASRPPDDVPPEIHAATPRVARIAISRLSHAVDADADGDADVVTVYVVPKDGRGRFVQMVGTLGVNVALLPGDAEARTLARVELTASELRDAYRTGLIGSHYTVDVPVEAALSAAAVLDVRVTYHDGRTGGEHTAHREIALSRVKRLAGE